MVTFVAFVVQEVSQPAIFVCSMAAVEKLRLEKGDAVLDEATCAMGLSLGEYSALCFAGAITFEDGVKVTKARSVTDAVADVRVTEVGATEVMVRVTEVRVTADKVIEVRLTDVNVTEVTEVRVTEVRVTEVRVTDVGVRGNDKCYKYSTDKCYE